MPTKHSIVRTVAAGVVIGLVGCAVFLLSGDSTIRRSLASTPPPPKNVRQVMKGAEAALGARSLQYDQDSSSPGVITRQDTGAEVWLINQPKCGTGTLLTSLAASMYCEEEPTKVADQIHTWICNNSNALMVTHTPENAMALRMERQANKAARNDDSGKCVVVTSIRDPHNSIPSLWFWMNRERCEFDEGHLVIMLVYYYSIVTAFVELPSFSQQIMLFIFHFYFTHIYLSLRLRRSPK